MSPESRSTVEAIIGQVDTWYVCTSNYSSPRYRFQCSVTVTFSEFRIGKASEIGADLPLKTTMDIIPR